MFDIIDIIACHRERHRQWEDHFLRRDWNNKIMMMAIGISTMIMVMVCHGNDPCQDRKYSLTFLNWTMIPFRWHGHNWRDRGMSMSIYDMIYYMFVIELTNGRLGIIVSYIVYKVIVLVVVDASAVAGGIGAWYCCCFCCCFFDWICDKLWYQGIPRWCRCVNVLRIGAIREQLKQIPHDASHVVVSVGGNNATGASTTVLGGPVTDCEEAKMRGAYRDCRWSKETWWNQLNMIPNDIGDDDGDDDDT